MKADNFKVRYRVSKQTWADQVVGVSYSEDLKNKAFLSLLTIQGIAKAILDFGTSVALVDKSSLITPQNLQQH